MVVLTQKFVLRDEVIERSANSIVELQKRENTLVPFLQKQLDEVTKKIDNLLTAIEDGLLNASAKNRLDELESKKVEMEISLAREKIEKTPLSKEQIVFLINKFKDGNVDDPNYRQAIVDIFVNSVFLFDDKLTITFNWKDGTKTMTLAELEAASENMTNDESRNSDLFRVRFWTVKHQL